MKKSGMTILIGIMALCFGCATVAVNYDYDVETNFAKFKTYKWYQGKAVPDDALAKNPLLTKRIRASVDNNLAQTT